MKNLSGLNLSLQAILFYVLILAGCSNSSTTNCSVDLKMTGHYEVCFYDSQKDLINSNISEFDRSFKIDIKGEKIQKNKIAKVNFRDDNMTDLLISPQNDTVKRSIQIKSTIIIDTIISPGSKNMIDHLVKGHSEHEIFEIINKNDSLKRFASTTFNVKMEGPIKGKSNDLLIDYLIDKYYLSDYIQDILKAIKDKE